MTVALLILTVGFSFTASANPAEEPTLGERAALIAESVAELRGIDSASAIIIDKTVIVGITTTHGARGKELSLLKKEVEADVLETDAAVRRVAVTSAPDLVLRIKNMQEKYY